VLRFDLCNYIMVCVCVCVLLFDFKIT